MGYDFIIIDSIICDTYQEAMYDEKNPYRTSLLDLQEISGNKIANKEMGLLTVTSETKELMERKCSNGYLPISISCLLCACVEIDIFGNDEVDAILKASSLLYWKKNKFCVLTGNSLLKTRLTEKGFEVYDLSQVKELCKKL